ncbi:DNA polymerase I [Hydrogenimonas sp.]
MKTLTVIDTFGFFFRSFYALPPLKNSEGFPTGLLTGFANLIHNLEKEYPTDYLVFALDAPGPSFRQKIDPNYKAQRPEAPPELKAQLPVAIDWIEKMGLSHLSLDNFEADDVIASMVKCAREQGMKVRIVSHDKDLYQLIDDGRVVLFDPIKRVEIDEEACVKKYGVHPRQFIDYQALIGDSSDNVPGVPGIGPKTAVKLLTQFGSLDGIYAHIDEVKPERIRNLLVAHRADAYRSRELVTLRDDIFDRCDLTAFEMPPEDPLLKIEDELKKYELRNILRRLRKERGGETSAPKKSPRERFDAILIDDERTLFEILESIGDETPVAIDTETDGLDTKSAALVGFSFCFDEKRAYYVPIAHSYLGVGRQIGIQTAKKAFETLLKKRFFGHNLKFDLGLLYQLFGFEEAEPFADTMLLAWLVDPEGAVGLDRLALRYFDHEMVAFKDTVKKGENFSSVPIETATKYAAEDAWMSYRLYFRLIEILKLQGAEHLLKEAEEVEYPFINLLICMERHGIAIDIERFEALRAEISERLGDLTARIYGLAGQEFNINSPRQMGHILFEVLGLPAGKKTKTGYSTNEKVLESLKGSHPIIEEILEYRELHKLMSTYIEPLLKLGRNDPKHRIYTSFIQTGTATGRLSSKNPNLQNIPVKTEEGRRIREGFVAGEGYLLAGIDYSQIELRFLAHFSKDPVLMEAFREGKDIHMETARRLFGEEAEKRRNIAKTVNFGLLYGMGSRKLAQTLGIGTKEAKAIIENYFASFPTVKAYLASIEEKAKERGYVETLLGRRRYFDFEHANAMQYAAYLREAGNTVFQGSTADLIKMAMLRIHRIIREESLDAAIELQIHDELIFEIREEDAEELSGRFAEVMEHTVELDVPLKTSINIGRRWSDLK